MLRLKFSDLLLVGLLGLLERVLEPGLTLLQLDIPGISFLFFLLGLLLVSIEVVLQLVHLRLQALDLRLVLSVAPLQNEIPLFEDHRLSVTL